MLPFLCTLALLSPTPESPWQPVGQARYRYLVFDVKEAELACQGSVDVLEGPSRLTFRYLRAFQAKDLAQATEGNLRRMKRLAGLEGPLKDWNARYPDVAKGDVLVLTRRPGQGVTLSHNGRNLGVVSSEPFARALLAIWLGPDSLDATFTARLRGQRR